MSTVNRVGTRWRKSSRTGGEAGDNCVEVALVGAVTAVRDSKNPEGPMILLPEAAFAALRKTV